MMAASLPEGDKVVDLLLKKEADVNYKSDLSHSSPSN
jgi:hypothetical protein